eukprot:TRINITY_DN4764_c0_g1_i2.p1 TRINITY_DN4764_c0_g1~~TRINITY_DN4764_c0_g1_i2.p1  ORF type:complete len:161 (+),score=27.27 TRINITY_DN4764_c0_g1_i2:152-634(+)
MLVAGAPSRVVNLSSKIQTTVDLGDLHNTKYGPWKAFARAMRAKQVWSVDLANRLKNTGVSVVCLHPGICKTNLHAHPSGMLGYPVFALRKVLKSPETGAQAVVFAATDPSVTSGSYYSVRKLVKASKQARDPAVRKTLWDSSSNMLKISPVISVPYRTM